jgi:hypothetical protein
MPTSPYWFLLNYSICRNVNWVHQCITNTYSSLCVTCTKLIKCYHTLFSSVLLHYSIPMRIYSHESSLNPNHAYIKHKILSLHCNLGGSFLSNHFDLPIQTLNPYLVSQGSWHISLITKIMRILNCWTSPFQLFALLDLVCHGIVCLCCVTPVAIDWMERTYLIERRVWTPKRQVTHMLLPIFIICISGFNTTHDMIFQSGLWNA